jgi:hypothetical protein
MKRKVRDSRRARCSGGGGARARGGRVGKYLQRLLLLILVDFLSLCGHGKRRRHR